MFTFNAYDEPTPEQKAAADAAAAEAARKAAEKSTFDQAAVDKIVADARRKDQAELQKTTAELKKLQASESLTAQEKANLQSRIEDIENQYKTKEQLAAQELEKQQTAAKTALEAAAQERDQWKGSFEANTIGTAILKTSAPDAVNVELMDDLLRPKSRVVPAKDSAGTIIPGQFIVMTKVTVTDAKTKAPVTLELPIEDAIKQMKGDPQRYGNLFKSTTGGGVGGSGGGRGGVGPNSGAELAAMSDADYAAWRASKGWKRK